MKSKISNNILRKAYENYRKNKEVCYIFDVFVDCFENPDHCVEQMDNYIIPLIQEERKNKIERLINEKIK